MHKRNSVQVSRRVQGEHAKRLRAGERIYRCPQQREQNTRPLAAFLRRTGRNLSETCGVASSHEVFSVGNALILTLPSTWLPSGRVQSTTTSVQPSSIADLFGIKWRSGENGQRGWSGRYCEEHEYVNDRMGGRSGEGTKRAVHWCVPFCQVHVRHMQFSGKL